MSFGIYKGGYKASLFLDTTLRRSVQTLNRDAFLSVVSGRCRSVVLEGAHHEVV